jgi:PEP-CTERM/exosortase A-associated glycosyltransferase
VRVLHILDHSLPLHSGYTFRTLSILQEQRNLGWETYHLTTPKQVGSLADEEEFDGWHFFRTRGATNATLPVIHELVLMRQVQRRLEEVVARVKPDILHAHSPVLNVIPALRVGRRYGIPVVYEVRAFWEDAAVDHGSHREWGLRYRATRALETWAMRRADYVTTICDGLRMDIHARGISSERISVIPNAVDPSGFPADPEPDIDLKAQLGLAGNTIVGFIGSFYAYEGLDLLLKAFPLMLKRMPRMRLLLVGGGPEEAALKDLARSLDVADSVIFAGRVAHDEVHRYYSIVDLFAYPRHSMRLTELVTPLKPLEAMAQTRLVVASNVGGHRELIRDGETGMLFTAGDAVSLADTIVAILADPLKGRRISQQARRFVEVERNWKNSVRHYQPVFERLHLLAGLAHSH